MKSAITCIYCVRKRVLSGTRFGRGQSVRNGAAFQNFIIFLQIGVDEPSSVTRFRDILPPDLVGFGKNLVTKSGHFKASRVQPEERRMRQLWTGKLPDFPNKRNPDPK